MNEMRRTKIDYEWNEAHLNASFFMQSFQEAEEQVLKNVLRQLLRRESTNEDARRVTRVFKCSELDRYDLMFDDVLIGRVRYNFGPINRVSVIFTPLPLMKESLSKNSILPKK